MNSLILCANNPCGTISGILTPSGSVFMIFPSTTPIPIQNLEQNMTPSLYGYHLCVIAAAAMLAGIWYVGVFVDIAQRKMVKVFKNKEKGSHEK